MTPAQDRQIAEALARWLRTGAGRHAKGLSPAWQQIVVVSFLEGVAAGAAVVAQGCVATREGRR